MNVQSEQLKLERTFAAPREEVFRAWTDPEVLRRWWAAQPTWESLLAETDVRVGGRYRLSMRDPDSVLTHDGIADERSRANHAHGWSGCLENLGSRVLGG